MAQGRRTFVDKLDFVTSLGHGNGPGHREGLGVKTKGPTRLVTDLCVMEPDAVSKELTVVSIHPGVTSEQIAENTGWKVKYSTEVADTPAPTAEELSVLRDLRPAPRQRCKTRNDVTPHAGLAGPPPPCGEGLGVGVKPRG